MQTGTSSETLRYPLCEPHGLAFRLSVTTAEKPLNAGVMPRNHYHTVEGLFVPKFFTVESVRQALRYKPRPDDVFIVSYPKCGTTWTQHIVYHIFSNGTLPEDPEEFASKTPFLELMGEEAVEHLSRPAAIKTHLPFHKHQYSAEAKYIYVTRNPYDCCVSFFHHVRMVASDAEDYTFEEFFEEFRKGQVSFGSYFDHLLSWYPRRNDPNVLLLTYESLKKDIRTSIIKIANFLGDEYRDKLCQDPPLLERIVDLTSFESMQRVVNPEMRKLHEKFNGACNEMLPLWAQRMVQDCGDMFSKPMRGDFVRAGKVGEWKSYFTPLQVKRMKEWIEENTAESDVMDLRKSDDSEKSVFFCG
ncbi:sulfotransferase 1E1-like [Ornithodoros turicata]|uniref:sulfotransferase 1E1-like n=1 Tax=Ornithodoros turicata TaxID=34597 RepID=UPI003139DD0D